MFNYGVGVIQQHMTFKGFIDSKPLLDRSHYFIISKGKTISAMLPRSWKKSVNKRINIPVKKIRCNECKDGILCITRNNQINENKEFEAKLIILKRKTLNKFGHMIPNYKI